MEDLNLEALERVPVRFARDAFSAKSARCDCGGKTRRVKKVVSLAQEAVSVTLTVLRCARCDKEYLNFDEARKLDKVLILSRALQGNDFKIRKSLSFDGDNYVFRIPAGVTRGLGKKPYAEMIPLSSRELLIHLGDRQK